MPIPTPEIGLEPKVVEEFRINSRSPDEHEWRYRAFAGSVARSTVEAEKAMARAYRDGPDGWEFRIETRTVTITATDWEPT